LFRRTVSAALVLGAIALGTAGCSFSRDVASLNMYSPSDGQQTNLDFVKARNMMILVAEDGTSYLIGSLVSTNPEPEVIKIQYISPETKLRSDAYFEIPALSKLDLGYNGNPAVNLPIVEVPGQTAKLYILESDLVSSSLQVPVLDGTLSEYRMVLEQLQLAE
jgi:hypothetical protein